MNKVESVTQSREKLHISVEKLLSKFRAAGIHISVPDVRDYNTIVTLDISYFDGLTDIKKYKP